MTGPMVSCLMVTRGNPSHVRLAIEQYRQQTYAPRELVIVCESITEDLQLLVSEAGGDVRLVRAAADLTLGDLRNLSVDEAHGELVCQWDDDDLYSPDRIANGVGALLHAGADALFLRQWFIWCPSQMVLSLSRSRIWEGSMIAFKKAVCRYPALRREEDTRMVDAMVVKSSIALLDDPLSYCYCFHRQNTSPDAHLQALIDKARPRFRYAEGLAAFSSNFAFERHPAFGDAGRIIDLAPSHASRGQARRLARYLALSHVLRRLKRS
jgi:glycosyltransferase involved in cell wall biosynthesis